jgi:hypothetical protein
MIATIPGMCYNCGQPIYVNDLITTTESKSGATVACHIQCGPKHADRPKKQPKPPCSLTAEGLTELIGQVRCGEYPALEASTIALLSIAASLVKLTEAQGWMQSIDARLETISFALVQLDNEVPEVR